MGDTRTFTLPPESSANVIQRCDGSMDFYIPKGTKGDEGTQGLKGDKGDNGVSATIAVGTTTQTPYGTVPTVTNIGTPLNGIFNFTFPKCCPPLQAGGFNATTAPATFVVNPNDRIDWILNKIVGTHITHTPNASTINLKGSNSFYHIDFNCNVYSLQADKTISIGMYLNDTKIYLINITPATVNSLNTVNWSGDIWIPSETPTATLMFKAEAKSVAFGKGECTCSIREFYE